VPGRNLLKFLLRPATRAGVDASEVPPALDVAAAQAELRASAPEVAAAADALAGRVGPAAGCGPGRPEPRAGAPGAGAAADAPAGGAGPGVGLGFGSGPEVGGGGAVPECVARAGREELEVVFLGTGASIPSKYRNVTGLYLHRFGAGGLLLDCGEGTYGQLVRRYGAGADGVLAGLRLIWISHIHADHHAGLARRAPPHGRPTRVPTLSLFWRAPSMRVPTRGPTEGL